jgi:hypothetical protein
VAHGVGSQRAGFVIRKKSGLIAFNTGGMAAARGPVTGSEKRACLSERRLSGSDENPLAHLVTLDSGCRGEGAFT